ncbi:MAG: glycoside hydrolase family 127 protein, partial [Bacteroidia bacterium]|nr:glycoside hydrolase family 127 protein [Bacteroidia bacterium]
HSKYGRNIYYHNDNELYVFQYISSELTWKEKGLKLIQETSFPEEQGSKLTVVCENPKKLAIMIRYPNWAEKGIDIIVNGNRKRIKQGPGGFIAVNRTWKSGDVIDIRIPFTLRLETMPDDSNRVALMYGPLVMAGDLGPLNDPASKKAMYVPVMLTENRNPEEWMKPAEGRINTFRTVNTGRPRDVELKPFYLYSDRRYSVYWDLFN